MDREFVSIGVYGQTEASFFSALQETGVTLFVDLRARRGMRGSEYAFVNKTRLEKRLMELGIAYAHALSLAPTPDVRAAQAEADAEAGQVKRSRTELGTAFKEKYSADVLAKVDWSDFGQSLGEHRVVALFCVERNFAACHRSLVAQQLVAKGLGTVTTWPKLTS